MGLKQHSPLSTLGKQIFDHPLQNYFTLLCLFVSEEFEENSVEFLFKICINPLRLIQGVPTEEVYLAHSTASAFLGGLLLVFHGFRQGFASACCRQSLVYTSQVAATSNMTRWHRLSPGLPAPSPHGHDRWLCSHSRADLKRVAPYPLQGRTRR